MKAMILLGINCAALGNTDISSMQRKNVDLDKGWLLYPRVKTGMDRRCPLWPETVAALKTVLAERVAKVQGRPGHGISQYQWRALVRLHDKSRTDEVTIRFRKLLRALKINGRAGLGFCRVLAHTFATVGLQVGDRDTVKALMGHAFGDVLEGYDQTGPSNDRRLAVTTYVRDWLYAGGVQ